MASRSALRLRLQRRLGLGVVSAVEQERLSEALNSGLARALSDGVPGLAHDTVIGSTLGQLDLTSVAVTANSAGVTVAGANVQTSDVMPHDILVVVDSAGATTKFLVHLITGTGALEIGIPASASITGTSSSYILRRALLLPSTGQVVAIQPVGANNADGLACEPTTAKRDPFKTGTARFYEQRYSEQRSQSFASLWPAPTDTTKQYTVSQAEFKAILDEDSDTLSFPEEALDAIIERARNAYITWSGAANADDLSASFRAVRDTSDALKNSSNAKQIFYKT